MHRLPRALITGGAGFIGSHLCEALLRAGHEVVVVDDESTGHPRNLAAAHQIASEHGHERLTYVCGNAADPTIMKSLVHEADVIYHLASSVGVALVVANPVEAIDRIVMPTRLVLHLASAACLAGQPKPVFLASSSEVYGKNPREVWRESDDLQWGPPTCSRWSYGVAKALDEMLALGTRQQTGLPVVIGRFFNVIGPRQSPDHGMVVPRFVAAARAGLPLLVHGTGTQQRCFADVRDVANTVIELTSNQAAWGEIVNIGDDHPVSILELAQAIQQLFPCSRSPVQMQRFETAYGAGFEDVLRRVPDLAKIRSLVTYRHKWSLWATLKDLAS